MLEHVTQRVGHMQLYANQRVLKSPLLSNRDPSGATLSLVWGPGLAGSGHLGAGGRVSQVPPTALALLGAKESPGERTCILWASQFHPQPLVPPRPAPHARVCGCRRQVSGYSSGL